MVAQMGLESGESGDQVGGLVLCVPAGSCGQRAVLQFLVTIVATY